MPTAPIVHVCVREVQDKEAVARMRSISGVHLTLVDVGPDEETPWQIPAAVEKSTEIILSGYVPSNLNAASNLRLLQIPSAGYEDLLGLDLPGRNIRACNAAGVFDVPIAEWNVAMMVNLVRNVPQMFRHQQAAIWDRSARFQREISGSVVGFWGYGGLARETARLCKTMGMTVHVLARSGVRARGNTYVVAGRGDPEGLLPDKIFNPADKEQFLRGLDFLIIAMPLTGQTEGLIGEAELRSLPPHAYVLNPARGPIIQEQALLKALNEGWISGAALDTHYHYPLPPSHPLWQIPNVILTPHISGSSLSQMFSKRVWEIFHDNVQRYRAGRPLLNELSARQLSETQ